MNTIMIAALVGTLVGTTIVWQLLLYVHLLD